MRRHSSAIFTCAILLAVGSLTMGGSAYADGTGKEDDKATMAAAAKVTIEQAIKTATGQVSGKVIEAELEKKHQTLVWEIEVVTSKNKVMEVHIDARTGAVIDVEEEGKD